MNRTVVLISQERARTDGGRKCIAGRDPSPVFLIDAARGKKPPCGERFEALLDTSRAVCLSLDVSCHFRVPSTALVVVGTVL